MTCLQGKKSPLFLFPPQTAQIPQGAIPVSNGFVLKSRQLTLSPYSTQAVEYYFYFPSLGSFVHYPVHVAMDESLVACARPVTLQVVNRPSTVDNTSWQYVSQQVKSASVHMTGLRDRPFCDLLCPRTPRCCLFELFLHSFMLQQ